MRITKQEHQELRARGKQMSEAAFAATHGWAVGDIAEAAHDITIGLFQSKVLVPEGARLVICGSSGNGLHPIAVHREDDEHLTLAVSASNLRRPNDRTERPAGQAGSSQPKESNDR